MKRVSGQTHVVDHRVERFAGLSELPAGSRIVTIGAFDGVHRGHQSLLGRTVDRAQETGLIATAVTFEPLPAQVLYPDGFLGRICDVDEKHHQIARLGVDELVTLNFDHAFSQQSPEAFLSDLAKSSGLRELWVGEAFALGRNRVGDIARIAEIGRDLRFTVVAVARIADNDGIVSSSKIRAAIMAGDATTVGRRLGRPFRVSGEVVHGAHLGRTIGYPTANVVPPPDLVPLADGTYVSEATLRDGGGPRAAMTYIGTRPTVNSGDRLVETHLLDFDADLYGQRIDVDVLKHLRGDATFDGLDPLIAQLRADETETRRFFAGRAAREPFAASVGGVYIDPRD